MRFMVIVKATQASEAGEMPSTALLTEMTAFNEEMAKAGVIKGGEGLHPSSRGARLRFNGTRREVIKGPFADTESLAAGFWIIETKSLEDAIAWMKRCPNPAEGESEMEIRQLFSAEDFGDALTPELREREERLRALEDAAAAN